MSEPRTKYHIIDSGNGGYQYLPNQVVMKNELIAVHNSGFFSCSSIALEDLMIFFNTHKCLPDAYHRHSQYLYYKHLPADNLIPMLFGETDASIPYIEDVPITFDNVWFQFSDYKRINFAGLKPFIDKYFAPSKLVLDRVAQLEKDYAIDYEVTIGILYRGSDKVKECGIAPYETFRDKLDEVEELCNFADVLLQPDETECLQFFKDHCGTALKSPTQWLHMPKDSNTAIFMHLPHSERPEHALNVLASIIMLSKCKHLITHTGNIGFWCCLYRGNMNNVHQISENIWL